MSKGEKYHHYPYDLTRLILATPATGIVAIGGGEAPPATSQVNMTIFFASESCGLAKT